MREILFRGKRKDNGEWVEGYYAKLTVCVDNSSEERDFIIPHDIPVSYSERASCFFVYPETVGQYTGLCDKNGNMIFEGDVVQFEDNNYVVRRECDTPGGYWAETGYILDHIGWNDYMHFTDTIDGWNNEICVEIIGNVTDNPELLKGGAE